MSENGYQTIDAESSTSFSASPEPDFADACYWEELEGLDPEDVCRRSGAMREEGEYRIRVLGEDYLVAPAARQVRRADPDPGSQEVPVSFAVGFAAVHYLINAEDIPLSGQLMGYKELLGGNQFFISHPPDFGPLLEVFSTSQRAVERPAETLDGRTLAHGDAAVEIRALPRLTITFIFWRGDEEFPASTSMLFDRTADRQLPLDVILALGQETMRRLVERAREEAGQSW